ncbi:MAG: hypothetical protein M3P26_08585 [Gemmatimonadota bacterium]|nr:hypothetical protein [Gemmatimonadota bacterium]
MLHTDIPHEFPGDDIHLGTAGWNIRRELERVARIIEEKAARGIPTWCIFDNTALGAATADALTVKSHLWDGQRVTR